MIKSQIYNFSNVSKNVAILQTLYKQINHLSCLDEGWIAGGFARFVYMCLQNPNLNIKDYLLNNEGNTPGDIDIFFKKDCEFLKKIRKREYQKSAGGFCFESFVSINKDVVSNLDKDDFPDVFRRHRYNNTVKIQYVTHESLFFDSIADCLNSFDLFNCCYAIKFINESQFCLYWTDEGVLADAEKKIHIQRNSSPFLLWRINKYALKKGLTNGLYEHSYSLLREWFYKVSVHDDGEIWKNSLADKTIHYSSIPQHIRKFQKEVQKIKNEDLILFINRWTDFRRIRTNESKYGDTQNIPVDWALEQIHPTD